MTSDSVGLGNTRGAVRRPSTAPSAFGNEHYLPRQPARGIHVRERQGQQTAASPLLQPPKEIRDGQPLETL